MKEAMRNLGPEPKLTDILNILLQLVNSLGALDQTYDNIKSLKVTINADMLNKASNIFTLTQTASPPVPNKSAVILADSSNAGIIYIGGEDVDAGEHGFPLEFGASLPELKVRDLGKVWYRGDTLNDIFYVLWGW